MFPISKMRVISFNVNGIRAIANKSKTGRPLASPTLESCLEALLREQNPDVLCLQEVKTQSLDDFAFIRPHFRYITFSPCLTKKGYSGVVMFYKDLPLSVQTLQYGPHEYAKEGRMITVEFDSVFVVTVYTPNSKEGLARIEERLQWETDLRVHLQTLDQKKPVILCGDLNCAYSPTLDIHNPKPQPLVPGLSPQERTAFQQMLDCGFVDSFRHKYPDRVKYSYWSNFAKSRERNVGWRLDYMVVSARLADTIVSVDCLNEYFGSDHCPVLLDLSL